MDLVGKPNTISPIWSHLHSCHPAAFVQVSSSSRDRRCSAGQVCIGEAFSKLVKYERDSGEWKMLTNVATYAAIPIPQRARAADEELTCMLARWRNEIYIYICAITVGYNRLWSITASMQNCPRLHHRKH